MNIRLITAAPLLMIALLAHAAAPPPLAETVVARIGAQSIPYADLDGRARDALAQQQREYDLQLQRLNLSAARARSAKLEGELNKLVDERVLALEAALRKKTPEQLLKAVQAPAPSEATMHAVYDSQRPRFGQSFETVKPQIEEYLLGEANDDAQRQYLEGLRARHHAVLLWEPLREAVEATGPERGPHDARITIVEFSDFQCPYCSRLAPVLKQLQETHPTSVRVVFRNFPLRTLHPNAPIAAQAGVCANAQGKFWEMHDAMYADQNALGQAALEQTAGRLGLDAKEFSDCLQSARGSAAITADEQAGERLGLTGTPGSFVNGRFVNGALPLAKWRALVDDELRRSALRTTAAR